MFTAKSRVLHGRVFVRHCSDRLLLSLSLSLSLCVCVSVCLQVLAMPEVEEKIEINAVSLANYVVESMNMPNGPKKIDMYLLRATNMAYIDPYSGANCDNL